MSSLPRWTRNPLVLTCLAILLFLILASSPAAPSYRHLYQDSSAKDSTPPPPSEIVIYDTDVADFYRGRTARWIETHPRNPPNSSCIDDFCRPVPELIAQPSPNTFPCPAFELNGTNPLVTIGVFSYAGGGKNESYKRELWRLTGKEGVPYHLRHLVEIRFILGRSSDEQLELDLDEEHEVYNDLLRIDGLVNGDNIDYGKTYAYLRHVYNETKHEPEHRPVFVMKTDLDSFLILPNILDDLYSFSPICAKQNATAYWGTQWGSADGENKPFYFRGLGYILSYPLLAWIASTPEPLAYEHTLSFEDLRTGAWMWWMPEGQKLWLKDEVTDAQDWDSQTVTFSAKVSIVHRLKDYALWSEYAAKIRMLWDKAGQRYMWSPQPWHRHIIEYMSS